MTDSRAMTEALNHVPDIDVAGELPLVSRKRLIKHLATLLDGDKQTKALVTTLGLICTRRAWPLWQSVFSTEYRPMELAETAVSNTAEVIREKQKYLRYLGEVKSDLDAKFLLGNEYFPAVYAGFAAWAVTRDVLSQDRSHSEDRQSDLQIPPEDWEPCFFASLAITGTAIWQEPGAPDVRRDFWEWYLRVAVPEAFTKITAEPSQSATLYS